MLKSSSPTAATTGLGPDNPPPELLLVMILLLSVLVPKVKPDSKLSVVDVAFPLVSGRVGGKVGDRSVSLDILPNAAEGPNAARGLGHAAFNSL